MAKFHELKHIVYDILKEQPKTRGDDYFLTLAVIDVYTEPSVSLKMIFENHSFLKLPSLESISRCRRKLQKDFPELQSQYQMQKIREKEMQQYLDFAKE
ncbi:MAG: hypothetical protein WC366_05515 [Bacilli bacterium]|jgi:hypothetical protein